MNDISRIHHKKKHSNERELLVPHKLEIYKSVDFVIRTGVSEMSDSVPNDSFDDIIADIEMPGTQDEPTAPSEPKKPRTSTGIDEAGLSDDELANLTLPDAVPGPSSNSNQQKQAASTVDAAGNRVNVSKTNCVLVNPKQRGNPILKSITNIPWEFDSTIVPDYVVGVTASILYLSLRYHRLNPDYIHARLKELGKRYELRILLVQVDVAVNACHFMAFFECSISISLRRTRTTR